MEDPAEHDTPEQPEPEDRAPAGEHPPAAPSRLKTGTKAAFHWLGALLPRLGLYLFMLAAPLLLVAYPAYLLVEPLIAYAQAEPIEVEFVDLDMTKVRDDADKSGWLKSRGHIEVRLRFKAEDGKLHVALLEKPWISPGLKGRLADEYQPGDPNVLHRMADGSIHLEEEVAKQNTLLLTLLMGLAFIATLIFVLIRKRLAVQQPEIVHLGFTATSKSVLAAQGVALLLSFLLTGLIFYQPVFIPDAFYLVGYWGLVVFLAISLRLLVFEPPHPAPQPVAEPERPRR